MLLQKHLKKLTLALTISAITTLAPPAQAIPVSLEILPTPVSITVTPSNTTLEIDGTLQYTAIAIFADDSTLDITHDPLTYWASEITTVASIGNEEENSGLATGLNTGETIITATYGNITSNEAILTVGTTEEEPPGPGEISGSGPISYELELEMHPEKRHDLTGRSATTLENNQDIQVQIKLFDTITGEQVYTAETVTNEAGIGTLPVQGVPEGVYDISAKTISHLRNTTKSASLTWPVARVDLSKDKTITLRAGDVNQTYGDNFVNGIDYSVIANQLYESDKKTDLNRDNIVNGIDFAITTTNIYQSGDN